MPKLAIDIEARFAQAMDALDGLSKKADQQARLITNAFKGVGTVLAAALGGAGFAAIGRITDSIAAYQDLADTIGDTASKVSGLQRASDQSGVSLDEIARASARLTNTLAKGGTEAENSAAALKAIGISFEDFKRASPVEQLERVALQLAKFEDGAGKTAIAMQLFGRAGAELMPFFNDLAEAGGRMAGLTEDQIKAADEFSKSLATMRSELATLAQSIVADMLPALNTLLSRFNELKGSGAGLSGAIAGAIAPGLLLADVNEAIGNLLKEQKVLLDMLEKPPAAFKDNQSWADLQRKKIDDLTKRIENFKKIRDKALGVADPQTMPEIAVTRSRLDYKAPEKGGKTPKETEAEKVTKWLEQQVNAAQKYNLLEQTAIRIIEAKEKANHGITDALERQLLAQARTAVESEKAKQAAEERAEFEAFLAQVLDNQAAKTQALADSYRALIDPAEQYRAKLREITDLEAEGALNSVEAQMAREAILEQMAGLEEQKAAVVEMDEFTQQAARNMQDHFADFLFDPFKDGLKGLAKNFAETVRRMAADAAAASILKHLLGDYGKTGVLGGVVGAFLNGGGGGSSTNTTGTTFRAIEGGSDAVYGSSAVAKAAPVINQTFHVNAGASRADMVRAAQEGKDQAVAEIMGRQTRV